MNRIELATLIFDRLVSEKEMLKTAFENSDSNIGYFFLDDLLPNDIALQIHNIFPKPEQMVLKKSLLVLGRKMDRNH